MGDIQAIILLIVMIPVCIGLAHVFNKGLASFSDELDKYYNDEDEEANADD